MTDNELDSIDMDAQAIANQNPIGTPFAWRKAYLAAFARAVLAKWGAPPQISESGTDYWVRNRALILQAIEDRGFRLVSAGGLFWLHGPSTQAQAGTVPLTDEQVESLLYKYGYDADDEHMAAMLKEANSIKGGQHGAE